MLGKLPRKLKKRIVGKKISSSKLNRLLKETIVIKHKYPYPETILPYQYCPKCGCVVYKSTNNMAEYPEVWISYTCLRCGYEVASEDNSPFVHCLSYTIPENRHFECDENCGCKKDRTIEETYWELTVPKQFRQQFGSVVPF